MAGHAVTQGGASAGGAWVAACFAAGVRLRPAGEAGLPATVEHAAPGPGHGVVTLSALGGTLALVAHPRHGEALPPAGEWVSVTLDPALTVVVPVSTGDAPTTPVPPRSDSARRDPARR
ncbi:MAG TPA: hypothetical protein VK894_13085 [Jiangellales bacterium]|nr:hypothetical protein [Jiangellales bacterium]